MALMNIFRAFLIFIWLLPFLYFLIIKGYSNVLNLTSFQIKLLIVLSFISASILFLEWLLAFRSILNFNKAFNYLRSRNINKLNNILKKINISKCYEDNKTLLQYAIDKQMDIDIISFLLSKGALVTYKAEKDYNISYTLFYLASYYEYIDEKLVAYFLSKGAYIDFIDNSRGFNSLSLLQVFVLRCHRQIVDLLLSKGADVDYFVPDLNMNTLMLAAKYINDPIIIEMLVNAGADVNKHNSNGYTPLLFAAEFNPSPQIIYTLVDLGAKLKPYKVKGSILRINNVTPLRLAVMSNNIDVINILIKLGDNINYKDLYGLSILFIASSHNTDVRVIELLIDNGASLKHATDNDGNTPLMGASYLNSNINVVKYLISITDNLGKKNNEGFSFIDYLRENSNMPEEDKKQILSKFF